MGLSDKYKLMCGVETPEAITLSYEEIGSHDQEKASNHQKTGRPWTRSWWKTDYCKFYIAMDWKAAFQYLCNNISALD